MPRWNKAHNINRGERRERSKDKRTLCWLGVKKAQALKAARHWVLQTGRLALGLPGTLTVHAVPGNMFIHAVPDDMHRERCTDEPRLCKLETAACDSVTRRCVCADLSSILTDVHRDSLQMSGGWAGGRLTCVARMNAGAGFRHSPLAADGLP